MMLLSAAALVATCTPTLGLHSSSSTTSSYLYFDFGSSLRNFTAKSAELRPPMPLAATPPVSGPMKAILTVSLACASGVASRAADSAAHEAKFMGAAHQRRKDAKFFIGALLWLWKIEIVQCAILARLGAAFKWVER